ncbi:MAG: U32 family peptidase [Spirochaetes bacterium]|nr:U32 family peptidase [Spirochaetota bacterium]
MKSNSLIELLSPAGSPEALDAAIGEGADSVYLGLRDFNARIRAKNFSYNQFEALVDRLHQLGKKVYVTMNTVFETYESKNVFNLLKYLQAVGPDAVIIQDMGLIELIENHFPKLKIHASTQMNVANTPAIHLLSRHNVKRVILSRELSLKQLQNIRSQTNSELEIFVHGALCISVSGLCLFSSYFGGKSANRGRCTQACRRLYGNFTGKSGYYFSPHDLQLIDYIPAIIHSGIDSLKIEGRMKSAQYIAHVVKAYRYLIDHFQSDGEDAQAKAKEILKNDFARNKTHFLFDNDSSKKIINSSQSGATGIYLGKIVEIKSEGMEAIARMKDIASLQLEEGDTIRIHSQDDLKRESLKIKKLTEVKNGVEFKIPNQFRPEDTVYLIQKKDNEQKYPHIIPKNLNGFKRHPGIIPPPRVQWDSKASKQRLFSGLYVKINDFKQFYILQADRPEKIIVHLNLETLADLLKIIKNTQFHPKDIIFYLEPDLYENEVGDLKKTLPTLLEKGYQTYICNNLGHINLLKNANDAILIGGPYLYTFNSYAVNFIFRQKINYLVSPLEISKRNLYQTVDTFSADRFFITVFAFPELFQIKAPISFEPQNNTYYDKLNDYEFYLQKKSQHISLMPSQPFSIIDKIPDLEKKGFKKFIIDLAFMEQKKGYYKKIMRYAREGRVIEETTRFNWKDGFYQDK